MLVGYLSLTTIRLIFLYLVCGIRLQNSTPVSYSEAPLGKKDKGVEESIMLEEGGKPEIYTQEHEKLLGHTERSWTLFEDGYGKDGKRIYDSVRGKTCHQCRLVTLWRMLSLTIFG